MPGPRTIEFIGPAEAEHHQPLVLLDDADRQVDKHEHDDDHEAADGQQDCELHRYLRSAPGASGAPVTRPSMMTPPARP